MQSGVRLSATRPDSTTAHTRARGHHLQWAKAEAMTRIERRVSPREVFVAFGSDLAQLQEFDPTRGGRLPEGYTSATFHLDEIASSPDAMAVWIRWVEE